jgi:uncharacterized protein
MKNRLKRTVYLLLIVSGLSLLSCRKTSQSELADTRNESVPMYDSVLAMKLGADEYGMKKYMMVFLKAGPNRTQDSATTAGIQKAHLANIFRLARERKLLIAGPFLEDGDIRGIFIFDVKTIEEAKELTSSDPAVQAGRLIMEIHPWYGPAALPLLDSFQQKIQGKSILEH